MKYTFFIFSLILFTINCKAQQMVQTPDDAMKLKINEQQFLHKPMDSLLKQIKPELKFVMGTRDYPSYFSFRFITVEELRRSEKGRKIVSLYVYVKELIDWNFEKRPKKQEYVWTKEDAAKYGGLDVIKIKVIEHIQD
ncbi:hypothetical protein [Flavobacterium hungaricum]|uniref:Uncharacterized protein n=1 Tax=Flavobacterium hungaricum TaxID=2082725 RepID=A0ABR9TEQ7_9FLAO|nr:hypothetical protein [Flavobacterium hungaricum]MBE8723369.1 hypothetical protein [Flavobacterium hungaricum]